MHVGKAAATAAWADSSLFSTSQHFCYLMVWFGVIWDFLRLCVLTCLIWGISHQWAENPPLVFGWVFWFVFFFCLFVLFFCAFVAFLVFFFFAFLFPESEVKSDISLAQDESPLRCVSFHCFSPSLQGKETIHRSQDMRICSQLFDV